MAYSGEAMMELYYGSTWRPLTALCPQPLFSIEPTAPDPYTEAGTGGSIFRHEQEVLDAFPALESLHDAER